MDGCWHDRLYCVRDCDGKSSRTSARRGVYGCNTHEGGIMSATLDTALAIIITAPMALTLAYIIRDIITKGNA